jgi:hypothetical protein
MRYLPVPYYVGYDEKAGNNVYNYPKCFEE